MIEKTSTTDETEAGVSLLPSSSSYELSFRSENLKRLTAVTADSRRRLSSTSTLRFPFTSSTRSSGHPLEFQQHSGPSILGSNQQHSGLSVFGVNQQSFGQSSLGSYQQQLQQLQHLQQLQYDMTMNMAIVMGISTPQQQQ